MEDGAPNERGSFTSAIKPPPSSSSSTSSATSSSTASSSTSTATGPRPHRCEICQRSFREMATLRKHEQLHRADRPYVCQTCGKSFLWSSNLKVHERVHTGERPYKCKICHRCFTQSNDLRRHERNVHMRGKLYGYKHGTVAMGRGVVSTGSGGGNDVALTNSVTAAGAGGGSHVNLMAYQAFAMQQRALLQQAMTYDFLQSSPMFPQPSGQALIHKNDVNHMAFPGASGNGAGGGGHRGGEEGAARRDTSQRSPIKLEQVTPPNTPGEGELHEKRTMPGAARGPAEGGQHSPLSPRYQPSSSSSNCPPPHPLSLQSPHRSPPMLLPVGHPAAYPPPAPKEHPSPLRHPSPHGPQMSPPGVGGARSSVLPSFSSFRHPPHSTGGGEYEVAGSDPSPLQQQQQQQQQQQAAQLQGQAAHRGERERENNHLSHLPPHHPHYPHHHQYSHHHTPLSHPHAIQHHLQHPHHLPHPHGMGGLARAGSVERGERRERDARGGESVRRGGRGGEEEEEEIGESGLSGELDGDKYPPCDSVMDLSISKTPDTRPASSLDSAAAAVAAADNGLRGGGSGGGLGRGGGVGGGDRERDASSMPPPKTPSSESECEGKRDVTTTSATPVADSGIHHCQHCNIFFYDYTMYHLHESLHLPYLDDPFRCPSCGKDCQDRVEFMFHTVWHVKYPHTIPNYRTFKENFIS